MQSKPCPKCSGSMSEGFVADLTHGGAAVQSWVEGAPRRSLWTGLSLSGRARSEIVTWRCGRCGFLEQYAPADPDTRHEKTQAKQALAVLGLTLAILAATLGAVLLLR